MRKYIFNGLAALTMGLAMTSCMQEFTYEEQVEKKILSNAEQTLGFHIPEGQDWVMSSEVTANISVNMTSGENYAIDILSNNPLMNDLAYVLASGEVANGGTLTSTFRLPSDLKEVYLTITDSKGETIYRKAAIENGLINHSVNDNAANSRTRANAVIDGDPFTFENTADYYKDVIPEGAKDINTTGDYDCIQYGVLYASTDIRSSLNLWERPSVDIYINGNVTIPSGAYIHSANIYVLPGATLTMNKQANFECNIYVSAGATLNYNLSNLQANTYWDNSQGKNVQPMSRLYNMGVVNFASNFEANNNVIVYNEGVMNATNITSKPGDGNPSYFYNFGDLVLTGKMELNSKSNFYNEGTVNVLGETNVTQKNIYWINKGHYTTGTMTFSAENTTFYNYCQLIVKGNAHMYDGEFNLMENSYTEAATSEMDNFIVNMRDGASYYVKGNTTIAAQQDYTFQGFRNINSGKGAVVKMGGTTTIASHKYTLTIEGGITYAINNVQIIKNGNVVTEDDLRDKGDGDYPVEVYNGVEATFDNTTVTANDQNCGGSTSVKPGDKTPNVWTYAFEDRPETGDYDMNDVVLKVCLDPNNSNQLIVKLVAAGCEYNNEVYFGETPVMFTAPDGTQTNEVHAAFGVTRGTLVNTGGRKAVTAPIATAYVDITGITDFNFQTADFNIVPVLQQSGKADPVRIATSGAPYAIVVPIDWKYPEEHNNIVNTYENEPGHSFGEWANDPTHSIATDWYNHPTGNVINN